MWYLEPHFEDVSVGMQVTQEKGKSRERREGLDLGAAQVSSARRELKMEKEGDWAPHLHQLGSDPRALGEETHSVRSLRLFLVKEEIFKKKRKVPPSAFFFGF